MSKKPPYWVRTINKGDKTIIIGTNKPYFSCEKGEKTEEAEEWQLPYSCLGKVWYTVKRMRRRAGTDVCFMWTEDALPSGKNR